MQVKSFRGANIGQALDQVKKELGENAIILGNKRIPISPTAFQIEVTAAVDPEAKSVANPKAQHMDGELHCDIQEIKELLSLLLSSKNQFAQIQLEQPLAEIYYGLLARGLDEKHTFIYLKRALQQLEGTDTDKYKIVEAFCRQLVEKIKFSRPFNGNFSRHGSNRMFSFLGPTGVGKTTTLAKIAADLKLKRLLNVGFISVDTFRIGAVDQLQTYANILGIPLVVAQSKSEFQEAIDRFRNHDVVLIDTIGKNFLRKNHVEDLKATFSNYETIHHFLVLSATAKDSDLKQTILHFSPLKISSIIFTKIDETLSHGCVVNQLLRYPHALSYLGTGQRVPEDIEPATHKRLLSLLFPSGNSAIGKE